MRIQALLSTKSLPNTLISAVSRSPEAAGMPVFFLAIRGHPPVSMEQHSCLGILSLPGRHRLETPFSHQSAVFNTILSTYLHILLANFSVSRGQLLCPK